MSTSFAPLNPPTQGGMRCSVAPVSSAHGVQHLLRRSGTASHGRCSLRRRANSEPIHAALDGPESHLFAVWDTHSGNTHKVHTPQEGKQTQCEEQSPLSHSPRPAACAPFPDSMKPILRPNWRRSPHGGEPSGRAFTARCCPSPPSKVTF